MQLCNKYGPVLHRLLLQFGTEIPKVLLTSVSEIAYKELRVLGKTYILRTVNFPKYSINVASTENCVLNHTEATSAPYFKNH